MPIESFAFQVNGQERRVETEPERPLLEVLREEFLLTGSKYGCGEGQCRACAVLLDGRPVTSCITPVRQAAGKSVVTIEGLAEDGALSRVQAAFLAEDAMQCGYCVPGMIVTATALLEHNPDPTEAEIAEFMDGNLCRCCGYVNIMKAIRRAADGVEAQEAS